jgi:hypothetical protein
MGDQPGPVGLVVVRRDHQRRVGPGLCGELGQLHRVQGVVGAAAEDQHRLVGELIADGVKQGQLLVV